MNRWEEVLNRESGGVLGSSNWMYGFNEFYTSIIGNGI